MKQSLAIFKALSDKNRMRILKMLENKTLCVCEINAILGLAVSTTSKHLSILKNASLICEHKEGKWVYYQLNNMVSDKTVKETLSLIKTWLNDDELIQKDRVKFDEVNRADLCKG